MDDVKVITNNVPRDIVDAWELTIEEQVEFDYMDWNAIKNGEESATFFRYMGTVYDLGEFQTTYGMPEFSPLKKWDGYMSDSFFSGIVVRFANDYESVVVGKFLA